MPAAMLPFLRGDDAFGFAIFAATPGWLRLSADGWMMAGALNCRHLPCHFAITPCRFLRHFRCRIYAAAATIDISLCRHAALPLPDAPYGTAGHCRHATLRLRHAAGFSPFRRFRR